MPVAVPAGPRLACRHVRVRGQVQGVGFRPFVYRLATELGLSGWVRNDAAGVEIEVRGAVPALHTFLSRLTAEAPALARIDAVEQRSRSPARHAPGFLIEASGGGGGATAIAPDTAVCGDCLAELFEPADRRYRYPFINCTHCGPRYTITQALPYDRAHTSMAGFRMCAACATEYHDPRDRRFHAQPDACPACGPRLSLHDADGRRAGVPDVIAAAVQRLRAGRILALKGLGGFHLLCDARNADAVAQLRRRKRRDEKPFAVMAATAASLTGLADMDNAGVELLASKGRPIVLLRKQSGCDAALTGVAPGLCELGVMLPYTPLHYLLFHEAAGRPAGTGWLDEPQPPVLVCTSANPAGEPLVTGNGEALQRLRGIADAFVLHDRDILVRCDDSVLRVVNEVAAISLSPGGRGAAERGRIVGSRPGPVNAERVGVSARQPSPGARHQFLRRARGFTPQAIRLAHAGPPVLACGGHLKNTVCLTRGDEAFVSQHIGDLDNAAACRALEETAGHLCSVLEIEPEILACDRHPDFFSSRFAARQAAEHGLALVTVQHHHAHIAAVMAEHGVHGPLLGLALDGVGQGDDGGIWGGELLCVDGANFERPGFLRPLALPGGDRAAREPWRMAASVLHALGRGDEIGGRFRHPATAIVRQMLDRGVNAPLTSSAGRLFDAAAGLLGVRAVNAFEGQAAMQLQALAQRHGVVPAWTAGYVLHGDGTLDLLPLLDRLADESDAAGGAALFHATLARALAEWVLRASQSRGIGGVALGGGCFLNRILGGALRRQLEEAGLRVLEARQVPPNDGGLSLGQAWVAQNTVRAAHPT